LFVSIGVEYIRGWYKFSYSLLINIVYSILPGFFDKISVFILVYSVLVGVYHVCPEEAVVYEYLWIGDVSFDSVYYQVYFVVVVFYDEILFVVGVLFESGFGYSLDIGPFVPQLLEYFRSTDPFLFVLDYYIYSGREREFEEGAGGVSGGIDTAWVYSVGTGGNRGGGIACLYGYGFKGSGFIDSQRSSIDGRGYGGGSTVQGVMDDGRGRGGDGYGLRVGRTARNGKSRGNVIGIGGNIESYGGRSYASA